jgi:DNA polymerase
MATRKPRRPRVAEGSVPAPVDDSLDALRDAAMGCKRCPLWKPATQTVFGEGPDDARVLVVGEQPGDQEDLSGRPFVGPSGKLFDRALEELGIDRSRFYVTNAVKHFKFERRGKARLHKSPNAGEQRARNVFGPAFRVTRQRGTWQALADGTRAFATVHPSSVLRQRGDAARHAAYRGFVADLALLLDA